MLKKHYLEELDRLRELTEDFVKAHPALAPMLGSPIADPDLARFFEGTAFQIALLRRRLDDDFPELVQELVQRIAPAYLEPVPAATVVAFAPKESVRQTKLIPAGTRLAARPIEGTSCIFTTMRDVEMHPLVLEEVSHRQRSGDSPTIHLRFTLRESSLSQWAPRSLRLYLGGEYARAATLYHLLCRRLRSIRIVPAAAGSPVSLPPECLVPVGLEEELSSGGSPPAAQCFPGFRLLQDYFHFPQRFLFLELRGWEQWGDRGDGNSFEVLLELDDLVSLPRPGRDSFILYATPASNAFPRDAAPILLDERSAEYRIRPRGNPAHYQAVRVLSVTGHVKGGKIRCYRPFGGVDLSDLVPAYQTTVRQSAAGKGVEMFLKVARDRQGLGDRETLSIELTCTNAILAEALRIGDVCLPSDNSPEFATFADIVPLSPGRLPPIGHPWLMWRLASHLALNALYLDNAPALRSLLETYALPHGEQRAAAHRGTEGVVDLTCTPLRHLDRGVLLRGRDLKVTLRLDRFVGEGDLYLFGSVLDEFFSWYASINSLTRLAAVEATTGEVYRWPVRYGRNDMI